MECKTRGVGGESPSVYSFLQSAHQNLSWRLLSLVLLSECCGQPKTAAKVMPSAAAFTPSLVVSRANS